MIWLRIEKKIKNIGGGVVPRWLYNSIATKNTTIVLRSTLSSLVTKNHRICTPKPIVYYVLVQSSRSSKWIGPVLSRKCFKPVRNPSNHQSFELVETKVLYNGSALIIGSLCPIGGIVPRQSLRTWTQKWGLEMERVDKCPVGLQHSLWAFGGVPIAADAEVMGAFFSSSFFIE